MAHHSPSPSGSTSRRLSELLGEQQEPFYLDLYLLEKGCSPAFLDAAACGGGGACSTCWPRARSTGGRLLRRPARSKKGRPRGRGVLRLLLSKILSATMAPAAATAAKKKRLQPAAIDWHRVDIGEKQRPPCRLKDAAPSPARAVESQHSMEVDEQQEEDEEEDDDEESSKKQLSPVSVLEQRLFEHSPPPPHAQKALVLFSELLEAAYTPTTLLANLANAKQYRSSSSKSKDGRRSTDGSTPTTRRSRKNSKNRHARRETEDVQLERDLARVTALVASEMSGARVRPEHLWPSAQDVGADIAAAVLEALTEEAAAELLMGMDHGCAADTARRGRRR